MLRELNSGAESDARAGAAVVDDNTALKGAHNFHRQSHLCSDLCSVHSPTKGKVGANAIAFASEVNARRRHNLSFYKALLPE